MLAVLSALTLDGDAARIFVGGPPPLWSRGLDALDLIVLKEISNFLLGPLLLIAAAIARALRPTIWRPLLYIALTQFAGTTIADLAKTPFGRLRPYEALTDGVWLDRWWMGAQSFPSGHTAFYASLILPIVALRPRWWPLLAIPLYVAAARVAAGDHYPSDVLASVAFAALISALLLRVARPAPGLASPSRPQ